MGTGLIPGWGTKIPRATWCSLKKKKKKKEEVEILAWEKETTDGKHTVEDCCAQASGEMGAGLPDV